MPFAQRTAAFSLALALTAGGLTAEATLHPSVAQAEPRGLGTSSVLMLDVTPQTSGAPRSTVLICDPTAGPHPQADLACRNVASVNGDLAALSLDPGPCTLEYAPVTATAWGIWQDRPVSYTETFANRCAMLRESGALFAF